MPMGWSQPQALIYWIKLAKNRSSKAGIIGSTQALSQRGEQRRGCGRRHSVFQALGLPRRHKGWAEAWVLLQLMAPSSGHAREARRILAAFRSLSIVKLPFLPCLWPVPRLPPGSWQRGCCRSWCCCSWSLAAADHLGTTRLWHWGRQTPRRWCSPGSPPRCTQPRGPAAWGHLQRVAMTVRKPATVMEPYRCCLLALGGGVPWSRAMPGYSRGRGCSGNPVSCQEDRGHAAGKKPGDGVRRWPGDPGKEIEACQLQVLAALFPVHPNRPRPLPPRSFHSYSSHCTSRYMDWESWPIVLLAVQMYSPASVYWMLFRVREDTRAWLRTTMCPSRVCRKGTESVRAQGRMGARRPGHHLCDQSHTFSSLCQCLSLTLGSN